MREDGAVMLAAIQAVMQTIVDAEQALPGSVKAHKGKAPWNELELLPWLSKYHAPCTEPMKTWSASLSHIPSHASPSAQQNAFANRQTAGAFRLTVNCTGAMDALWPLADGRLITELLLHAVGNKLELSKEIALAWRSVLGAAAEVYPPGSQAATRCARASRALCCQSRPAQGIGRTQRCARCVSLTSDTGKLTSALPAQIPQCPGIQQGATGWPVAVACAQCGPALGGTAGRHTWVEHCCTGTWHQRHP